MKTATKPEAATLSPEFTVPNLSEMMGDFNFTTLAVKFAIGYAFAITGFIAAWDIAVTVALMVSAVWLQYIIVFACFAILLAGVAYATPHVVNACYNAGAFIGNKAKSLFTRVKNIEVPSFATKH